MKSSFVKEIETSENVLALLAKRNDIVEAVHDTFLSSQDIEVVERLCVALSDLYRGDERGRKLHRNGETTATPNHTGHSPVRGGGGGMQGEGLGGGVPASAQGGGSGKESLINRRCLCLQFLPAILIRYLSLLVSQTSKEEMVLSLIEAFLVVICTSSTKKLSASGGGSRSASMNELDSIGGGGAGPGDSFVVVPNLLKPSVYMYNNEVLFAKDFISYPASRVEVVKLRSEPSISKLDSSNRQEVLTFTLSQYNSYLSQFNLTSQKHFCHMCSCFAISGFDLTKTKLLSGGTGSKENKSNTKSGGGGGGGVKYLLNKRFVLSQSLMIEMLQGLYQLSFLLSLREECVAAVEHVAFRARHSLMPQVLMMTHSVRKAIDRSVLKQDDTILSAPEAKFQDRVKAVVTSDALRMAARRESIRLEHANYYYQGAGGTVATVASAAAGINSVNSTASAETESNAKATGNRHDVKQQRGGTHRGNCSTSEGFLDPYSSPSPSSSNRPAPSCAAMQELQYYKLGNEAYFRKQHHLSSSSSSTPTAAPATPPSSLPLDLSGLVCEGYGSQHFDINTSNTHALNVSYSSSSSSAHQHPETTTSSHPSNAPHPHTMGGVSGTPLQQHPSTNTASPHSSPRHCKKSPPSVPVTNGKETKEKASSAKRSNDTTAASQLRNDSGVGSGSSSSAFGAHRSSPKARDNTTNNTPQQNQGKSSSGKKSGSGSGFFSTKHSVDNKYHSSDHGRSKKYVVDDDEDSDRTLVDEYSAGRLGGSFNSTTTNSAAALTNSSMKSCSSSSKAASSSPADYESTTCMTSEVRSMVRSSIAAELLNSESSSASAPLAVVTEL